VYILSGWVISGNVRWDERKEFVFDPINKNTKTNSAVIIDGTISREQGYRLVYGFDDLSPFNELEERGGPCSADTLIVN
jgi:hypothetical protein